jgi:hypothetical protein
MGSKPTEHPKPTRIIGRNPGMKWVGILHETRDVTSLRLTISLHKPPTVVRNVPSLFNIRLWSLTLVLAQRYHAYHSLTLSRRSENFLERSKLWTYGGLWPTDRHTEVRKNIRQLPDTRNPDKNRVMVGWHPIPTRFVGGEDLYTRYSPDS